MLNFRKGLLGVRKALSQPSFMETRRSGLDMYMVHLARQLQSLSQVFGGRNAMCQMYPIPSMYVIFTYIYHKNQPNVGKYTIHGWYGYVKSGGLIKFNMFVLLIDS